jgi:hypothetical protein
LVGHFVVVLDVLLFVVEADGVLSLSQYVVELAIQVDSSLLSVQMHQAIALLSLRPIAVLCKIFIHHAVTYKLLDELHVLLRVQVGSGGQSLH